jgi:hypothetical protein
MADYIKKSTAGSYVNGVWTPNGSGGQIIGVSDDERRQYAGGEGAFLRDYQAVDTQNLGFRSDTTPRITAPTSSSSSGSSGSSGSSYSAPSSEYTPSQTSGTYVGTDGNTYSNSGQLLDYGHTGNYVGSDGNLYSRDGKLMQYGTSGVPTNTPGMPAVDPVKAAQDAETKRQQDEATGLIQSNYALKYNRLAQEQEQESATSKAMQFKLVRSDTPYGEGVGAELKSQQAYQTSLLRQEEAQLIAASRKAIFEENYQKAKDLQDRADKIAEQRRQARMDALTVEAHQADMLVKKQTVQKMTQDLWKEKSDIFSASMMSFDPKTGEISLPSMAEIQKFSEESGIPTTDVVAGLNRERDRLVKLTQEERKRELEISQAALEIKYAGWSNDMKEAEAAGMSLPQYLKYKEDLKNSGTPGKIVKVNGTDYVQNADGSFSMPTLPPEEVKRLTDLQKTAGAGASTLLQKFDSLKAANQKSLNPFAKLWGVGPVGTFGPLVSSISKLVGGSEATNFSKQYDNLIAKLQLDDVKYLKGQGAVSDSERQILKYASTNLSLAQTEEEFRRILQDVTVTLGDPGGIQIKDNGTYIYKNRDGSVHQGNVGDGYIDKTVKGMQDNWETLNSKLNDEDAALVEKMLFDPALGNTAEERKNAIRSYFYNRDSGKTSFNSPVSSGGNSSIVPLDIGGRKVQVSSTIASPLQQEDQEFYQATGKHLAINEGLRSSARQAQLYNDYKSGKGGRAAPPGKSFHETGNAVDIANWKEAEKYLRKYGFRNDLADDKNHFSIGEFNSTV